MGHWKRAFLGTEFITKLLMPVYSQFAWFFFKIMNISGAEAVVAAASPWIGQGESACLVKPYVDLMVNTPTLAFYYPF